MDSIWNRLRASLHGLRQDLAADRALRAELASYTTEAEVADLLGAMSSNDSVEAERVRSILMDNLAGRPGAAGRGFAPRSCCGPNDVRSSRSSR